MLFTPDIISPIISKFSFVLSLSNQLCLVCIFLFLLMFSNISYLSSIIITCLSRLGFYPGATLKKKSSWSLKKYLNKLHRLMVKGIFDAVDLQMFVLPNSSWGQIYRTYSALVMSLLSLWPSEVTNGATLDTGKCHRLKVKDTADYTATRCSRV